MRLPLERKESECLKLIYNDKISGEESCELVIPDTCGDVGTILDVRGQVLISSKKSSDDSICVSAVVDVDVLFLEEDGESVHCVSAKLPFELSTAVNGANEDTQIVADIELCSTDARMLNPRKLLIRAELISYVRCYNEDRFVLWEDVSCNDDYAVHLQKKHLEHSLTAGVGEKSFSLSDEYAMPKTGDDSAKLLSCVTKLCVNDVKTVGNKLIFKAVAETNALFLSCDGEVFSSIFETQFSQIIESDSAQDEPQVDIILYLTSADFVLLPDKEDGVIAVNFKISAQSVCVVNTCSAYIADAYSCRFPLEIEKADVPVFSISPAKKQKLRLEGTFGDVSCNVLYAYCAGVCMGIEGGKVSFRADIRGVGKGSDGELIPLEATLKGCEETAPEDHQHIIISCLCCGPLTVTQNSNLCIDLFYDMAICEHGELRAICALEIDEDCPVDSDSRPSLVIICANNGADLWTIAKKYGSDIDAIIAANSLHGEFSETMRPLIVPKV